MRSFAGATFLITDSVGETLPLRLQIVGQMSMQTFDDQLHSELKNSATVTSTDSQGPSTLDMRNYELYFTHALELECNALRLECEDHALFRVPLSKYSAANESRKSIYG